FFLFLLLTSRLPGSTLFPLHDALPIFLHQQLAHLLDGDACGLDSVAAQHDDITGLDLHLVDEGLNRVPHSDHARAGRGPSAEARSEEHTSELQSPCNLVCRLLLEKKKK